MNKYKFRLLADTKNNHLAEHLWHVQTSTHGIDLFDKRKELRCKIFDVVHHSCKWFYNKSNHRADNVVDKVIPYVKYLIQNQ